MVNINTAFPSEYLKADDIWEMEVPVVISHLEMRDFKNNNRDEQRPVIFFRGKEKGLVLNKTNSRTIADMYGEETDMWTNQNITLGTTWTDFGGKQVKAIRVRPGIVKAAQGPDETPPATEYAGPDLDDEIPF